MKYAYTMVRSHHTDDTNVSAIFPLLDDWAWVDQYTICAKYQLSNMLHNQL